MRAAALSRVELQGQILHQVSDFVVSALNAPTRQHPKAQRFDGAQYRPHASSAYSFYASGLAQGTLTLRVNGEAAHNQAHRSKPGAPLQERLRIKEIHLGALAQKLSQQTTRLLDAIESWPKGRAKADGKKFSAICSVGRELQKIAREGPVNFARQHGNRFLG